MSSVQSARGPVLCSSSWLCHGDLSSVLHVTGPDQTATTTPGITSREECVILELPCPTGDAIPCTLTISSAAQGTHHILEVSLCSEARTIEVYSLSEDGQEEEEYLGTSRGEKCSFRSCGDDEPFTLYRAYLKFDFPVPACKVKLLSLGEKQSVLVGEMGVHVTSIPERSSQTPSVLGTSINLERVQSMMDSMGGKMSPGAEQLMNMVRAQQKNQAPFGSHLLQLFGSFQPQAYRSKKDPKEETPQLAQATPPDTRLEAAESHPSVPPPPPTDLKSAMSSFLQNQLGQSVSPESILPLLQNLTVQRNIDRDSGGKSCSMPREKELEPSLEKVLSAHMERLERNLMKHVDERMRCLQEHLDTRIDQLFVCLLERGGKSNPHPATAGDKLVNGHMDYQDSDCNILSVQ
ncbi:ATPase PAAT isoform X1 [Lithobates pipiens]